MKPVILHEIVVGHGEFLYRKSSQAEPDVCSVSHGKVSSYVACSKIMSEDPWVRCCVHWVSD